jgi:hypothetical protein
VTTNVLGVIRLNDALLHHIVKQPKATVVTVSSGLATEGGPRGNPHRLAQIWLPRSAQESRANHRLTERLGSGPRPPGVVHHTRRNDAKGKRGGESSIGDTVWLRTGRA